MTCVRHLAEDEERADQFLEVSLVKVATERADQTDLLIFLRIKLTVTSIRT